MPDTSVTGPRGDTIRLGGLACIGGAIWFAVQRPTIRRPIRPIDIERGLSSIPPLPPS